jgi:SAM-dependent methyltransferase
MNLSGWYNGTTGDLFTDFPVGSGDIVADIGCGTGGNASWCAAQGASLILVDIDAAALAEAAARIEATPGHAPFSTHVSDGNPLPIADGAASRIVCTEVIEHVDSPEILMQELFRIGQPGALYLLACPDPASENVQKHIAHPVHFQKPNHIRIVSQQDFETYITGAGLIIESRHSYGFYIAMWWHFFWAGPPKPGAPQPPLLESWEQTWRALLDFPGGMRIKNALDDIHPKSQVIVARKPSTSF